MTAAAAVVAGDGDAEPAGEAPSSRVSDGVCDWRSAVEWDWWATGRREW